jgi:mannitol/fructose-specific phosphotransferase system IIA component (Ntr-type)
MSSSGMHLFDEALSPTRIFRTREQNKEGILNFLIRELTASGEVDDPEAFRSAILMREGLMSTGIGLGIGVPHARISSVRRMIMAVAVNDQPLDDYESIDNQPVQIVFMVAGRPDQQSNYVRLLASLSRIVKDNQNRDRLIEADTPDAIYTILHEAL